MFVAAKNKHSNHNQFFCDSEDYVLVYPDQKIVDKIPGTIERFTVSGYKKELAKPYSRMDLYLCKAHDLSSTGEEEITNCTGGDNNTEKVTPPNLYDDLPTDFVSNFFKDDECQLFDHDLLNTPSTSTWPNIATCDKAIDVDSYLKPSNLKHPTIKDYFGSTKSIGVSCPICFK